MTDAVMAIAGKLTSSYLFLGYTFRDDYPLENMSIDIYENLKKNHPNVTIEQIIQAMDKGINGYYGEVKGLFPVDVVRYVKRYTTPENIVNYQAPEEKTPLMLNRDVKCDRINTLCELYRQYCTAPKIILCGDFGPYITLLWDYNMLLNIKDVAVQQKYMDLAKETLRREKLSLIGGIPRMADVIKKEIEELSEKDIKEKSYKLIILDFFKDCKEMDIKNLRELFNN